MTASIIPLATSMFDFKAGATAAYQALGINVVDVNGPRDYLKMLGLCFGGDFDPLLKHLSHSFIVLCYKDTLYELIMDAELSITMVETVRLNIMFAIVSGTMFQWKQTITSCSTDASSYEVRELMTQFLKHFDRVGLSFVFSEYNRKRHNDGTLLLEAQ